MSATLERLETWLRGREDEHLEFKEAKQNFDREKLTKYCAALANERGGHLVLGVSDKRPRKVVGSQAFQNLGETQHQLLNQLKLRVEAIELIHANGRVVVFDVPSRPIGTPIAVDGAYWMRSGESLVAMTPDMLRTIFDEAAPDYSAEVCSKAKVGDLLPDAIARFRDRWIKASNSEGVASLNDFQLLSDAELIVDGRITYAALVLFGSRAALGRHLAQAEVAFEYRSSDATGPAQDRRDFRQGFFTFMDELWEVISLRNDVQSYQDGLFMVQVPTFSEGAVREALLNAIAHRDYRLGGSVFVRQYSRRLEVVSPGGFLPGITAENALWQQQPRNRRIAEAFQRCGLVERSGQGMNRMFEESIKQGKPRPDFTGTDAHQVFLTLRGELQDPVFLRFLEKVGATRMKSFTTQDLLVLDLLRREEPVPEELRVRLPILTEQGVIERAGKGRHILSKDLYGALQAKGTYTRKRGLEREFQKELLLKHVRESGSQGAPFHELTQVLPERSAKSVQDLMRELKKEGKVIVVGRTKAARWHLPEAGH